MSTWGGIQGKESVLAQYPWLNIQISRYVRPVKTKQNKNRKKNKNRLLSMSQLDDPLPFKIIYTNHDTDFFKSWCKWQKVI